MKATNRKLENRGFAAVVAVVLGAFALPVASTAQTLPPTNNLVMWLKADSLALTDGAAVNFWDDSSGSGHYAVLLAGWNAPTFATNGVNGRPGVFFGPSSSLRVTNNVDGTGKVPLSSGLTFAATFKTFSTTPGFAGTAGRVLIEDNNGLTDTIAFGVSSGVGDFQRYQSPVSPGWYSVPSSYAVNNTNVYQGHFLVATHSSSSGLAQLYADQRFQGSNSIDYNAAGFQIIGDLNGARYFDGWIGELLVYNTDLTGADQLQLQTYLTERALDIPEPSAVLLLSLGGLLLWRRRCG